MPYSTMLLDFDHTLFDFDAAEPVAFAATLRACGIPDSDSYSEMYSAINRELWRQVELGMISPDEVHTTRFERLVDVAEIDIDPLEIADEYLFAMGANGDLYPGVTDLLLQLSQRASLALVTNGLSKIQRARFQRLDIERYFDAIVISTEVGSSKPSIEIFDATFELLGRPDKSSVVIVGDSLASDIKGGNNYGIATCWYNPTGTEAEAGFDITHEISSLDELLPLVD